MEQPFLYRRVLGESYQQLHPLLQEFHDRPQGKAEGVFRIVRPAQGTARKELALHAARDFAYALLFGSLAWRQWEGCLAWLLAGLLLLEICITLQDFVEEDISRKLPAGERIMHTVMAIVYGAFLANLLPQMHAWSLQPTGFVPADYGVISWLLSLFAVGVFCSGLRDLVACLRLKPVQPIRGS